MLHSISSLFKTVMGETAPLIMSVYQLLITRFICVVTSLMVLENNLFEGKQLPVLHPVCDEAKASLL